LARRLLAAALSHLAAQCHSRTPSPQYSWFWRSLGLLLLCMWNMCVYVYVCAICMYVCLYVSM
jgi:hypothetical protein